MVDIAFIEDEESVVGILEGVDLDGRVLRVVFVEVESDLLGNALGVDACGDTFFAFGQEREDGVVDIIINQNEAFFGRANEFGDEGVGIMHLPVIKNALLGFSKGIRNGQAF